ncbi:MAG TPA: ribosome biogenesis GTP-binding protein YsxC [Elusimicrobia bacterium]|nr:ribosome biogenesis GTP-binding protein YsxC [Elusimicrobiota bacterium]
MLDNVGFLLSETRPGQLPVCSAAVAFVGRSNVGKSSLLNALCRKELARVSNLPGRTRAINVFQTSPGHWLVDLPGYGYAGGPMAERAGWGAMIEEFLTGRPSLRMVFALVDAKIGPTKLDLQMAAWLRDQGLPWRAVATKADQVGPSRAQGRRREAALALGIAPAELRWTSAKDGFGVRELRGEVAALLAP